jgi:hypothetical protein
MAKRIKLSKQTTKLLDEYAGAVSDHREWNNAYEVKRTRAALVRHLAKLEEARALYVAAVYRREPWRKKLARR